MCKKTTSIWAISTHTHVCKKTAHVVGGACRAGVLLSGLQASGSYKAGIEQNSTQTHDVQQQRPFSATPQPKNTHGAAADEINAVRSPVGVGDVGVDSHGHALAVHAERIGGILEVHLAFPAKQTQIQKQDRV